MNCLFQYIVLTNNNQTVFGENYPEIRNNNIKKRFDIILMQAI